MITMTRFNRRTNFTGIATINKSDLQAKFAAKLFKPKHRWQLVSNGRVVNSFPTRDLARSNAAIMRDNGLTVKVVDAK